MTTVRTQALQAIKVALQGIPGFAGLQVHRNPHWNIKRFPTVAMFDGPQRPMGESETNSRITHEMDVLVEAYVERRAGDNIDESGDEAGDQASELHAAIVKAVFNHAPLLAVVHDLFQGPMSWDLLDAEDGGVPAHIVVSVEVQVRFQTARDDPSAPAP